MSNFQLYTGDSRVYPTYGMLQVTNGAVVDFLALPVPADGRWSATSGPATVVINPSVSVPVVPQLAVISQVYNPGTGAPTTGSYTTGELAVDSAGAEFLCTASGTPGTWSAITTGGGGGAVSSVAGRTGAVVLAESDITSLTADLAAKAPLASPAFTGTPTVPTAAGGTSTTQAASTAFVAVAVAPAALVPTAVKTANYTAAAQDLVPCDTTSAGFTVTLPTAPADKARVVVKHVTQGSANVVTVACGGSDVFNKTGGATSFTLPMLAQGALLQYQSSGGIWYILADDLPLTQLDTRYNAAYAAKDSAGFLAEANVPPRLTVPRAKGVVCFTFDDGYAYYDTIRQLMNGYGQRGTFYIQSNYINFGSGRITSAQLAQLAADGHEIGDHTATHPDMTGVAASGIAAELDASKTAIEAVVGAGKVNAFAYPSGLRNSTLDMEVSTRYWSARSVANFVGDGNPPFLYRADRAGGTPPLIAAYPWGTNYPGDADNTRSHANVLSYIRLAAKYPVIFIVLAHDPSIIGPPTDAQIRAALQLAHDLGVPCLTISEVFGQQSPLLDPGFEDTTMAPWIKQGTAGETAAIVTDTALTGYYGSTSLHLNVANIANNVYVSQAVPVIPGRAYTFGGHAKVVGLSAGAPGLVPRIRWKNFDGSTTINSVNGTALTSANNGAAYAPISVTATVPVNCAYAQLDWLMNGVTGDAYVSHCFLQGNETGAFG